MHQTRLYIRPGYTPLLCLITLQHHKFYSSSHYNETPSSKQVFDCVANIRFSNPLRKLSKKVRVKPTSSTLTSVIFRFLFLSLHATLWSFSCPLPLVTLVVKFGLSKRKVIKKARSVNFVAEKRIPIEPYTSILGRTIKPAKRWLYT